MASEWDSNSSISFGMLIQAQREVGLRIDGPGMILSYNLHNEFNR